MYDHFSRLFCSLALIFTFLVPLTAKSDLLALDSALIAQEAAYPDIVKGTEKTIYWHSNEKHKTDISIVYIHGFSASRQELSPVTEILAKHLKANVFYTRLQGHGRSDDAMAEGTIDGWKRDVKQAYEIGKQLGDKVVIVSTSTGGTLATWLVAQDFADSILTNIMISPNFGVESTSAKILKWSWGLRLAKWTNGDYHSFTPVSEAHDRYWTNRYPLEAVVPMLELVDEINDLDKSKITTPQLLIYSPEDVVVDVDAIIDTSEEFSAAQVKLEPFTEATDHVQHVLAGAACSPESTDTMIELLRTYIQQIR